MKNTYLTVFDYYSGRIYQTDLTEHFTEEQFHKGIVLGVFGGCLFNNYER